MVKKIRPKSPRRVAAGKKRALKVRTAIHGVKTKGTSRRAERTASKKGVAERGFRPFMSLPSSAVLGR